MAVVLEMAEWIVPMVAIIAVFAFFTWVAG